MRDVMATSALDRIEAIKEKLKADINALKEKADREIEPLKTELAHERAAMKQGLKDFDRRYAKALGKTVRGQKVKEPSEGAAGPKADVGDERELERLLKSAPDHSLNRKGLNDLGYNLRAAKIIAKNNVKKFKVVEKGPQATISLIK